MNELSIRVEEAALFAESPFSIVNTANFENQLVQVEPVLVANSMIMENAPQYNLMESFK